MNVEDLNEAERAALTAAVACVVNADGHVAAGELDEVDALGEELGLSNFREQLEAMLPMIAKVSDILPLLTAVERPDARELIRTLLVDLAHADGDRGDDENAVLDLIREHWVTR